VLAQMNRTGRLPEGQGGRQTTFNTTVNAQGAGDPDRFAEQLTRRLATDFLSRLGDF
jgi:hypothetical protein